MKDEDKESTTASIPDMLTPIKDDASTGADESPTPTQTTAVTEPIALTEPTPPTGITLPDNQHRPPSVTMWDLFPVEWRCQQEVVRRSKVT